MNAIEKYEVALTALERGLMSLGDFEKEIAPLRDVVPVVHGKWIKQYRGQVNSICSVCGKEVGRLTDFCPHCGAKMDKGKE